MLRAKAAGKGRCPIVQVTSRKSHPLLSLCWRLQRSVACETIHIDVSVFMCTIVSPWITGRKHAEQLTSATAGLPAKQQERILDARYQDIQDCLNLDDIFPHLCQHHLLTSAEKQELLNPMYTSNYKIHKLMTWIPRKGCDALHHFIICLRHSADGTGHQELADKLEKEARKGRRQHTTKKGIDSMI